MPEIDISRFEAMTSADLENARRALISRGGSDYTQWPDELLSEMAAITSVIRRKVSGPPKEKKPSTRAKKSSPAELDDLA